jgi:hypothetical protein
MYCQKAITLEQLGMDVFDAQTISKVLLSKLTIVIIYLYL